MTAVALLWSRLFFPRFGLVNWGLARPGVIGTNRRFDKRRAMPAIIIPVFIGFHPVE